MQSPFPTRLHKKNLGSDPDRDEKSIRLTVENKINSSLGSQLTDNTERTRYLFRKKELFSSFLRGPEANSYAVTEGTETSWA